MSNYHPDAWVIIKITNKDVVQYKVLAGWYGGYTNGDSWKINSGITVVRKNSKFYEFDGYSGSTYICSENTERLTGLTASVLESFQSRLPIGTSIEVIPVSELILSNTTPEAN